MRTRTVNQLGYTPRQTAFLRLVAAHGGYFMPRQWLKFNGQASGNSVLEFFSALVMRGHARALSCGLARTVYYLATRRTRAAFGGEDRRRTKTSLASIVRRLMALDVVLEFGDRVWYGTVQDKVALFTKRFNIDSAVFPGRAYRARSDTRGVSYFFKGGPVGVAAPFDTGSAITFMFISHPGCPYLFRTFLRLYGPLMSLLPSVVVMYVSAGADWGAGARTAFARVYPERPSPQRSLTAMVAAHFKSRSQFEAGTLAGCSLPELNQFRSDLHRFGGLSYDRLYHLWRSKNEAVTDPVTPAPRLELFHLPFKYTIAGTAAAMAMRRTS